MYYTIHAKSFGDTFEDIGQELDTFEDAMAEAAELWPGCVWSRVSVTETTILVDGAKVAEIHAR